MRTTDRTTLLDVVEARQGELRSSTYRRELDRITVRAWATYLDPEGPRYGMAEPPTKMREALEAMKPHRRRWRQKGRALLSEHGPAEQPEWAEAHSGGGSEPSEAELTERLFRRGSDEPEPSGEEILRFVEQLDSHDREASRSAPAGETVEEFLEALD